MAAYSTGTITLTNGSDVVTGTGTAWLANAAQGQLLQPLPSPTISLVAYVAAVVDNGKLRLESPWAGDSYTGIAYQLVRDFDPLSNTALIPNGNTRPDVLVNRAITRLSQYAATGDKTAAVVVAQGAETFRTLAAHCGDFPTPMDWGAVGDGIADDTAALQAAWNAVAVIGGGCLHLGGRNFRVTAPISLYTGVRTKIRGPGTFTVDFSGANLVAFSATNPTSPSTRGGQLEIENVAFNTSVAVQSAGTGPVLFEHMYCSSLRLVRCTLSSYANNTALRLGSVWNAVVDDTYVWGAGCQRARKQIPTTTTFSIAYGATALQASAAIFDASDVGQIICVGTQIFTIQSVTDAQNAVTTMTAVRTTSGGVGLFDGVRGAMAAGSTTLTLAAAVMTAADVGRLVYVLDAKLNTYPTNMLAPLRATITAVSADGATITLDTPASATVTNSYVAISPAVEITNQDGANKTNDFILHALQVEQFRGIGLVINGGDNVFMSGLKLHGYPSAHNNTSSLAAALFTGMSGYIAGADFEATVVNNIARVMVSCLNSALGIDQVSATVMDDQPIIAQTSGYSGSICNIGNVTVANACAARSLTTPYTNTGVGVLNVWGALGAYANAAPVISVARTFRQPVAVQSGSLAAPGMAVAGDSDTGLAQVSGANTVSLVAGAVEALRVSATYTAIPNYLAINNTSNLYDRLIIREDAARHIYLSTISDTAAACPYIYAKRARVTGTASASGDHLFWLDIRGNNGVSDVNCAAITVLQTGAVNGSNVPAAIVLYAQPASGVTYAQEILRANGDYSVVHRGNAQTIINANSLHTHRPYTVAGLPAAATNQWAEAAVSNPTTGKLPKVMSDGTNWLYMDGSVARAG
ncbi:MAG: hypothetical protein PW843_24510 [Azospirillaceae bacterium]|nr:hypothetical protein [Azospirillaceae bacterium]